MKAARFIARVRRDVRRMVAEWTGEYQYTIDQVIEDMIKRANELNLRLREPEEQAKLDFIDPADGADDELSAQRAAPGGALTWLQASAGRSQRPPGNQRSADPRPTTADGRPAGGRARGQSWRGQPTGPPQSLRWPTMEHSLAGPAGGRLLAPWVLYAHETRCFSVASSGLLPRRPRDGRPVCPPRTGEAAPTFTKDVAPILFKNCAGCHRPGEIAPMSLLTYEDARPWAKAIRDEVSERQHAAVARRRAARDVSQRAQPDRRREGHRWSPGPTAARRRAIRRTCRRRRRSPRAGALGKPDVVFEMQEDYKLPADGTIQYQYFYIPTNFTEPKWVKSIEVRPGNREVVHHVLVYYRAKPDMPRTPVLQARTRSNRELPTETTGGVSEHPRAHQDLPPRRILATYAPGTNPQVAPAGTAFRLEPGGIIELQMHYTTNGEAGDGSDEGRLHLREGPVAARGAPGAVHQRRVHAARPAPRTSAVDADVEFLQDATVWGIFPHTHLRGKKWEYKLILPDGTSKTILSVPRYDFNWQTYYMFKEPLQVPKGAKIVSTAWYDNSAANKSNPDPKIDVKWGDQTWEEMQYTGAPLQPGSSAPRPRSPSGNNALRRTDASRSSTPAFVVAGSCRQARPTIPSTARSPGTATSAGWCSPRCVRCHSPRATGPMSLITYEDARPWARAMREEVLSRRMPKWHAARGYGEFANDPRLSPFDIALVVAWVDGGAIRGPQQAMQTAPAQEALPPIPRGLPDSTTELRRTHAPSRSAPRRQAAACRRRIGWHPCRVPRRQTRGDRVDPGLRTQVR